MCYPLVFGIFITAAHIEDDPAMHNFGSSQLLMHYLNAI
jgi:hypothetical protein